MATVTRYVNTASTAGGDGTTNATTGTTRAYATLSEWEADEQTDLTSDTDVHIVYCEGTTDDGGVDIDGWTTSADYYIQIEASDAAAGKHQGVFDTDYYLIRSNDYYRAVKCQEAFVRFIGLQVENYGTSGRCQGIWFNASSGDIRVISCIIKGSNHNSSVHDGFSNEDVGNSGNDIYLINSIIYDFNRNVNISPGNSDEIIFYNNTFHNAGEDNIHLEEYASSTIFRLKNNLCQSATDDDYDLTGGDTTDYNHNTADDSSAPSGNAHNSTSITFTDEGNDDFTIGSSQQTGEDLSSDSHYSFSVDITGATRSSWDVGAHEYVAAGPSDVEGWYWGCWGASNS